MYRTRNVPSRPSSAAVLLDETSAPRSSPDDERVVPAGGAVHFVLVRGLNGVSATDTDQSITQKRREATKSGACHPVRRRQGHEDAAMMVVPFARGAVGRLPGEAPFGNQGARFCGRQYTAATASTCGFHLRSRAANMIGAIGAVDPGGVACGITLRGSDGQEAMTRIPDAGAVRQTIDVAAG